MNFLDSVNDANTYLQESLESESFLKRFTDKLYDIIKEKTIDTTIRDRGRTDFSFVDSNPFFLAILNNSDWSTISVKGAKRNFKGFMDFFIEVKNMKLGLGVIANSDFTGKYGRKRGTIAILIDPLEYRIFWKRVNIQRKNANKYFDQYFEKQIKNTLIHELTHVYDDYISQGKAFTPVDMKAYNKGEDVYLQYNPEVNARYVSFVRELDNNEWRLQKGTFKFKDVLEKVNLNWDLKYNKLTKDQQKRVIIRLKKWWEQPLNKWEVKKAKSYYYESLVSEFFADVATKKLNSINEFKPKKSPYIEFRYSIDEMKDYLNQMFSTYEKKRTTIFPSRLLSMFLNEDKFIAVKERLIEIITIDVGYFDWNRIAKNVPSPT